MVSRLMARIIKLEEEQSKLPTAEREKKIEALTRQHKTTRERNESFQEEYRRWDEKRDEERKGQAMPPERAVIYGVLTSEEVMLLLRAMACYEDEAGIDSTERAAYESFISKCGGQVNGKAD